MADSYKTYIVPVRVSFTEEYEVRARSAAEAMDKIEQSARDPLDSFNENREVDYHGIREREEGNG